MPKPSPLIVLLVIAAALADLAIQRTLEPQSWYQTVKGLVLGGVLAQAALLTLWLVFGRWNFALRLVVVVAAVAFLADLAAPTTRWTDWNQWLGALFLFGLALATPLFVLRTLGMRLASGTGAALPQTAELPAIGRQFSLRTILIWITGFCVVLGFMRGWGFPWEHALEASVHCVGFAVVALVSVAAVLGGGNRAIRLAAVVVASLAIGWLMGHVGSPSNLLAAMCGRYADAVGVRGPNSPSNLVAVMCGTQAILVGLGAWVVRISGVRLGWDLKGLIEK